MLKVSPAALLCGACTSCSRKRQRSKQGSHGWSTMAESRKRNRRMRREYAEPVVDFGDRRATRGAASSGALVRPGRSGSGACHPVVVRGMDQQADCCGVRRAHGPSTSSGACGVGDGFLAAGELRDCAPEGAGSRRDQRAGGVIGARTALGARGCGSAELDPPVSARRDRTAHRGAPLEVAAQPSAKKGGSFGVGPATR